MYIIKFINSICYHSGLIFLLNISNFNSFYPYLYESKQLKQFRLVPYLYAKFIFFPLILLVKTLLVVGDLSLIIPLI